MRSTRRALLQLGTAMLASAAVAPLARADQAPKRSTPRYFLQIVLFGGIDAILTTDPKEKSDVEPAIDLPYPPDEIAASGEIRFGPHFSSLGKWASKTTVLNSVFVGTAN